MYLESKQNKIHMAEKDALKQPFVTCKFFGIEIELCRL